MKHPELDMDGMMNRWRLNKMAEVLDRYVPHPSGRDFQAYFPGLSVYHVHYKGSWVYSLTLVGVAFSPYHKIFYPLHYMNAHLLFNLQYIDYIRRMLICEK